MNEDYKCSKLVLNWTYSAKFFMNCMPKLSQRVLGVLSYVRLKFYKSFYYYMNVSSNYYSESHYVLWVEGLNLPKDCLNVVGLNVQNKLTGDP